MAFAAHSSLSTYCISLTPGLKKVAQPPAASFSSSPIAPTAAWGDRKKLPVLQLPLKESKLRLLFPRLVSEYRGLLNACVDRLFDFCDQPLLPSQSNFAPVDEVGERLAAVRIEGEIPKDFPEGVYIRNGPNALHGALQATTSIFGRSSESWVEGEGMLHAVYFNRDEDGNWIVTYNNKYVETDTLSVERQRGRPTFLPQIEGEPAAILAGLALNMLRYGKTTKYFANNGVIEYAGRVFATAENHMPQEVDVSSLETCGSWSIGGAWKRPLSTHAKKIPKTGELVVMGVGPVKPYVVTGVVSGNGNELIQKVDLEFKRCTFCHDIGVTEKYNIILDFPFLADAVRVFNGGPLLKYEKDKFSRIGVIPRYGNASSIKWFEVDTCCMFHIVNCHEDHDEVIVRGITSEDSIVPGPEFGRNKNEWFSRGLEHREDAIFFTRLYEWRLNLVTGGVVEGFLSGTDLSIELPFINERFNGLPNHYAYAQVVNCTASSTSAMPKFGGFVKIYLQDEKIHTNKREQELDPYVKTEVHHLEKNLYCSGASFIPRQSNSAEDHGWVVSFVHDEDTNTSQVHIVDCQNFEGSAVAKIILPSRVPYGFHGAFIPEQSLTRRKNSYS